MVTVSTTIFTNNSFNMILGGDVAFFDGLQATGSEFSWASGSPPNLGTVKIFGSGLSYSGSGDDRQLAAGTISSIAIDISGDSGAPSSGDLLITGTAGLDVTLIDNGTAAGFWGGILGGNDIFLLSGFSEVNIGPGDIEIAGDDFSLASGLSAVSDQGGDDEIYGADNGMMLIGDIYQIFGNTSNNLIIPATYTGGNDKIVAAKSSAFAAFTGDAWDVFQFGELIGGNDQIDASLNDYSEKEMAGDASRAWSDSFVNGGDDLITMGNFGRVAGDVFQVNEDRAIIFGGDDVITGDAFLAAGDIYTVLDSDFVTTIACGNDTITGGDHRDVISGDLFERYDANSKVSGGDDILRGGGSGDLIYGEVRDGPLGGIAGGNDTIFGGGGGDDLFGQMGNDAINGGAAGDALFGQQGNDVLSGGGGADNLTGGAGRDSLSGGGGADKFQFARLADTPVGARHDRIADFSGKQGDKIDLGTIDAMAGTPGHNFFAEYIGNSSFSAEGQIRAYQSGANTIVELNTSGSSGAEAQIELVDFSAAGLTFSDFLLAL